MSIPATRVARPSTVPAPVPPDPAPRTDDAGLLDDLLEAAEQAQDEVSGALHDGPVQALIAARIAVDLAARRAGPSAGDDAVRSALQEATTALRSIMGATRRRRDPSDLEATLAVLADRAAAAGVPMTVTPGPDAPVWAPLTPTAGIVAHRLIAALCQASPAGDPVHVQAYADGPRVGVLITSGLPGGPLPAGVHRWLSVARLAGIPVALTLPGQPRRTLGDTVLIAGGGGRLMTELRLPTQASRPDAPAGAGPVEELL